MYRPNDQLVILIRQSYANGSIRQIIDSLKAHREELKEQLINGCADDERLRIEGEARLIKTIVDIANGE